MSKLQLRSLEEIKTKYPYLDINDKYKQIFNILENTNDMLNIVGEAGCGKAQPLDTIIPTPNGYKRFGDLKVGDYVFDRNGKPTKVIGVYPRGKLDLYKVTLSDGRETFCNDDHLWSYYTSRGNLKTVSLREMIDKGIIKETRSKNDNRIRKNCRFKIPTHNQVEFNFHDKLPIDPYVIGAFIGNGCNLEKQLSFSSNDEFTVSECSKLLNFDYDKLSDKNYTWVFRYKEKCENPNKIRPQTLEIFSEFKNELCVKSNLKRIPQIYKTSSIKNRLSLIQGLFDTDGSITESDGRMNLSYSTTSINLANDIKEVLLSLGYVSSIHLYKRDNKNDCYTLNVNINDFEKYNFFRLPRKLEKIKCRNKNRNYNMVGIKKVTPMNTKVEMMCIKVDNDEELYLTNDYIVTHNTTLLEILNFAIKGNVMICASTGVASSLLSSADGVFATTIHSAFNIAPQTIYSNSFPKLNFLKKEVISNTDCLIIDEMSMVNASLFDYLINLIKYTRHGSLPRIILFSDILQLEPVIGNNDVVTNYFKNLYKGNVFYFNSNAFKDLNFKTILLNKVYRQNGDNEFKDILNRIRVGKATRYDLDKLNTRVATEDEELYWEIDHPTSLKIVTTNKNAERYNNMRYELLEGEEFIYRANMTESFVASDLYKSGLYPEEIKLKIGASVMILKNDINKEYVNGDMGIVESCDVENRTVRVKLNSGKLVTVHEYETDEYDYYVEKNDDGSTSVYTRVKSSYINVPLKLAYATTVHKSQGLTLDYGCFDKGSWVTNASVYVALSRFKRLEGFILSKPLEMKDILINDEALSFLNNVESENNSILDDKEYVEEKEEKKDIRSEFLSKLESLDEGKLNKLMKLIDNV